MSHQDLRDKLRVNLLEFTRAAFKMLPTMDNPSILDVGCGSGIQTIELAKICNGHITAIDIDIPALVSLRKRVKDLGLSHRISVKQASMHDLNRVEETYDVIWAEGSIGIIGFIKGLREWKRLIKPNGFLVVHDGITNVKDRLKKVPSCGYKLINHFMLPKDAWWEEYFKPLEIRINKLYKKYKNDPEALKILDKHQKEIDMVKANPKISLSAFYLFQKVV